MNGGQTALVAITLAVLIVDVYYTRKWIRETRKAVEHTRRWLRSIGYVDPGEDEPE
jgi:hypothetical protein